MAVTKVDYPDLAVRAAESVLLELIRALGKYLDHIVAHNTYIYVAVACLKI